MKTKKLFLIITTSMLMVACNCQDCDLCGYTKEYLDSVKKADVDKLNSVIASYEIKLDSITSVHNTQLLNCTNKSDSLLSISQQLTSSVNSLTTRNNELLMTNTQLETEKDQLSASNLQLTNNYNNLLATNTELTTANIKLTNDYNSTLILANQLKVVNNQLTTSNTECLTSKENLIVTNSELINKVDSLQGFIEIIGVYGMYDSVYVNLDTAFFSIGDSTLTIQVEKKNNYSKVTLIDNDNNRVYVTKLANDLDFWAQSDKVITPDSTTSYTRYSSHFDLRKDNCNY
jgi:hypothetical protein